MDTQQFAAIMDLLRQTLTEIGQGSVRAAAPDPMLQRPTKIPAFPDFMEEVRFSWDWLASAASVLKQVAQLISLEAAEKLGLAGFPPVDSTIVALVEAQVSRLANTVGMQTAYMDGLLRENPLPEPVATELRLMSCTLLQISGLQGHALGRSLASLVVARRQLWLSQARVPDAPISLRHTFGPAVEVAALLPPCAPAWGRSNRWQAPPTRTVTRTVPVPTAPLAQLQRTTSSTS
ncbi:UNVERIFIED_CONTAM: hypothetical protein FKN15_006403 [Acipenser sinensis]